MKNLVFDFGGVLVDWNPHRLFDGYFGSREKADWFLENICTQQWNSQTDAGKPIREVVAELSALHPEYAREIEIYYSRWIEMMGGEIEGMYGLLQEYKAAGYHLYGLTNWSAETFCLVRDIYPIFKLLDGMVVSGEEHCIKPDPRIFCILFDRYGLRPADCIFVDDLQPNIDGALAVGMDALLFTGARTLKPRLNALLGR